MAKSKIAIGAKKSEITGVKKAESTLAKTCSGSPKLIPKAISISEKKTLPRELIK